MSDQANGLFWKLRRVAAGLRQQDVASLVGISTTRYSAIERGEVQPSPLDSELIENALPPLPGRLISDLRSIEKEKPREPGKGGTVS